MLVEPVEQLLVVHFVQELQVVSAVVQCILNQVLKKFLGQVHVVFEVVKSHFGLYHPEFGQVTGRVRVFRPECWSESINLTQSHGKSFAF